MLSAFAIDEEGHSTSLGTKTITLDNEHATKPFGAIDTPAQGATIPGATAPFDNANAYPMFGWAMTQTPECMASYQVLIDGVTVPLTAGTNWFTGLTRADLSAAFPGLCDSNKALAVYYLNASALGLANGLHTVYWGITDDGGNTEAIGSRYFTLLTASGDAGPGPGRLVLGPGQASGDRPATAVTSHTSQITTTLQGLVANRSPIRVRIGMDDASFEMTSPDATGRAHVQMPAIGRVTLDLGSAVDRGYEVVGDDLRTLPIGSTLDPVTGRFYWQPPVGFLGTYHFVFIRETARIDADVTLFDPMVAARARLTCSLIHRQATAPRHG